MYMEGKGNMCIKLPPFITIADSSGNEMDQGTLLRYLGEMAWFPTAYLSDYIQFLPVDENSAEIIMDYGGVRSPATVQFNNRGEIVNFSARRYMESNGKYTLENWMVSLADYRAFSGIKIPTQCEITWKLKSGDFSPIRLELTDVVYDDPSFI